MNEKYKNFLKHIKNKNIMFCGIGRSNIPLVNMFKDYANKIIVYDKRNKKELKNQISLFPQNIEYRLGSKSLGNLDFDIIFRTPGMNFLSEELTQAKNKGITVTSEMEVFFDICPCKIIGITGSDGKTTVTTLISEMLKRGNKKVHMGGNIGSPLLPKIDKIDSDDIVVVELSSFQLISMRKSPNVAVITNLSPNHLDVHKDMQEYIEAKKNIILHQNAFSNTILNLDNLITKDFKKYVRGKNIFFTRREKINNGVWLNSDGTIIFSDNYKNIPIISYKNIKLKGNHNLENYMASIAAVYDEVTVEDIRYVAKNFSGVEHRIEFIKKINDVEYYNDSIASTPTRTISGTLSVFDKKIVLIAGGYDKNIPFDDLGKEIIKKVKKLILLGSTSEKIYKSVISASKKNQKPSNIEIIKVSNMQEAVDYAYKTTSPGDIVVLSPACASFDLYKDFEIRGNHFKQLVQNLPE